MGWGPSLSELPYVLYARNVDDDTRVRIVVPAAAVGQIDALKRGELATADTPVTYLSGASCEVLDIAGRRRIRVRWAQCGLGTCACDLQWWPADRPGPVPDPEWFDELDEE